MYSLVLLAVIFRGICLTPRKSAKIRRSSSAGRAMTRGLHKSIPRRGSASLYAKLRHPSAQRAWIKAEDICRTV